MSEFFQHFFFIIYVKFRIFREIAQDNFFENSFLNLSVKRNPEWIKLKP